MARSTRQWDEDQLVKAFNQRHADALKEVFCQLFKARVFLARNYVKAKDIAEDIVQNVFIELFDDRTRKFDNLTQLEQFTYLRVASRCIDHNRQVKRINNRLEELRYLSDPAEFENIEGEIIRAEIIDHLVKAIEKLAPQQKKVMELTQEGFSTSEIARLMGITPRTVQDYRQTAFTILRGRLSDNAFLLAVLIYSSEQIAAHSVSL